MSRFARGTAKNLLMLVMVGATIYMLIDLMEEDEAEEENPILKRLGWAKEDFQHPGEISNRERQEFYENVKKADEKYKRVEPPQSDLYNQLFKGIPGGPGALLFSDSKAMDKYNENLKNFQASNNILMKLAQRRNEIIAKNALEKQRMMDSVLGVDSGANNLLGLLQGGGAVPQQMEQQIPAQGEFQNPPPNGLNYANFNPGNAPNIAQFPPGMNNLQPGFQNSFIDPNQGLHPDKVRALQQLPHEMNLENPNLPQNNMQNQQLGPGGQLSPGQLELLKKMMDAQNRGMGNPPPINNGMGNLPPQNNGMGNLPHYEENNIQNPPRGYQNNPVNIHDLPPYPGNSPSYIGNVAPNEGNNPFNMENLPSNNIPNNAPLPPNSEGDPHSTNPIPQDIPSATNSPSNNKGEIPSNENNQVYLSSDHVGEEPQVEIEGNDPKAKELPPYLDSEEPEKVISREEMVQSDNNPNIVPANQDFEAQHQEEH